MMESATELAGFFAAHAVWCVRNFEQILDFPAAGQYVLTYQEAR